MLVQVMAVGEVFGTFYAIKRTQSRQVFGGFGVLVLGEMFRGFEVRLHLVEIASKALAIFTCASTVANDNTYRVRRFVLMRLILPMAAATVGKLSLHRIKSRLLWPQNIGNFSTQGFWRKHSVVEAGWNVGQFSGSSGPESFVRLEGHPLHIPRQPCNPYEFGRKSINVRFVRQNRLMEFLF